MYVWSITFKFIIGVFVFNCVYSTEVNDSLTILPNEKCQARKTLITVDVESHKYFPIMVELYRCNGVCGNSRFEATSRKCVKEEAETLQVFVFNELSQKNETLEFANHTKCGCECVEDGSVCGITQKWDKDECKCLCDYTSAEKCPNNHRFNPSTCQCQCDLTCPERRLQLNASSCSCYCPDKFYIKCSKKGKLLRETDCKCFSPSPLIEFEHNCNEVPTKWAVVIIIISFLAFFILTFDCVLYGRNTGCLFLTLHLCVKEKEETIPFKGKKSTQETFESNA